MNEALVNTDLARNRSHGLPVKNLFDRVLFEVIVILSHSHILATLLTPFPLDHHKHSFEVEHETTSNPSLLNIKSSNSQESLSSSTQRIFISLVIVLFLLSTSKVL
jgi:hypothetical protein